MEAKEHEKQMVEGRTKRSSHGASLGFVADVLAQRGCQLAFNLDGGQTAAMVSWAPW